MSLILEDEWIWDFWLARDGAEWHLFFLHAPKVLVDPELRHRNAVIGHARSFDLERWKRLDDALVPGTAGEWDDLATWTGSIVRSAGTWWMFYTGVSTVDEGRVQRIGAATSSDLSSWTKLASNPLLGADSQWYELYDPDRWYEEAWRDPWVFADPMGDGYHMFITARDVDRPSASAGAIGHATSPDLLSWAAGPPIETPANYGHLEVCQHVVIADRHYLLFSVPGTMQPDALPGQQLTGIGYFVADDALGPYRRGPTPFITADHLGTLYAGRIVFDHDAPVLVATIAHTADGSYVGGISDPIPVVVGEDGELSLGGDSPRPGGRSSNART
jgi:beta-fructofuranosidase